MKKIGWNLDNTYERLPSAFYKKVQLNPVPAPELVVFNEELSKNLGLDSKALQNEGLSILAANNLPEGASSISQAYMGHQFGYLTMLGDGRAILIGEQITPYGDRYDLQYKGSGPTPFSRGGDGKAVLGPMLREYIVSEAMYHLGIPTTRSLSVTLTGERILRNTIEKGAVLVRVASSHIRVGTFVYAANEGKKSLKALADYTIKRHFPKLENEETPYLKFFEKVIYLQAKLIAKWMLVGFVHGVMNTDNMTISGETIDYGPCAFLDIYDPKKVFSSIDRSGRYAYNQQADIALWNLVKLGETLIPLIDDDENIAIEKLNSKLEKYWDIYNKFYYNGLAKKLGLKNIKEEDYIILDEFLDFLKNNNLDFTNSFIDLTFGNLNKDPYKTIDFIKWKEKWLNMLKNEGKSKKEIFELMKQNNPAIIPRNHWIERALEEANKGNYNLFFDFLESLKEPYAHAEYQRKYSIVPENLNYVTYCGT